MELRGSGGTRRACAMSSRKHRYFAHVFQVFKILNRGVKLRDCILWKHARAAVLEFFLEQLL
jgi:hypothetical protein